MPSRCRHALHCVHFFGTGLHKLEHANADEVLGQGFGRAVANQTIGSERARERRLISPLLLFISERYLRLDLPDRNRANQAEKEEGVKKKEVKEICILNFTAFNIALIKVAECPALCRAQ